MPSMSNMTPDDSNPRAIGERGADGVARQRTASRVLCRLHAMRLVVLVVTTLVACKSSRPAENRAAVQRGNDGGPSAIAVVDAAVAPDAPERAPDLIPNTAPARKLYTNQLADAETFAAYSKEIGNERFAKFVVDLKTDAVWYFDVNVYPVHKDFIFTELYKRPKTKDAVRVFDRNYGANKTDFLLCYLVHHIAQDVWTFAFWDGDLANADHVRRAYRRMKATFFLGDRVEYRPDSNFQEHVAKRLTDVPYILNDQLYKLSDYQVFNKGVAVGTLHIARTDVPETDLVFATDSVVILPAPLSDITPVAGILSDTFSTPLSHVSLRAKGWGIPNIGLRNASKQYASLAGKQVYFEAKDSEHVLRLATDEEIAAAQARRATKRSVVIPKADRSVTELELLATMDARDFHTVGPKAANLGIIIAGKIPNVAVPPGFGVPFHYYHAHIEAAGIDKQLAALIADPAVQKDAVLRKTRLEAIRKAIVEAPLAKQTCDRIGLALGTLDASRGVFVRSSHNAEDLDDFSGAGLHDTVPNVKGLDRVCAAIKRVWASAWKISAYDARAHAGIDQSTVSAAALVQTAVNATAAGVLATVHPTDPSDDRHYTINAKSGLGMAVVDGRKVPESLLVSWYNHGIRVLSRSDEDTKLVFDDKGGVHEVPNPNKGKPVLTNRMAIAIADAGRALTKLFKNPRLDVEWVYAGDELYIVQTRPLVGDH